MEEMELFPEPLVIIDEDEVMQDLTPFEMELAADNELRFELPINFQPVHAVLRPEDLDLVQNLPPVIANQILSTIQGHYDYKEIVPFFYLTTGELPPFVLNFFLDRMVYPAPNTNNVKFYKALKLINLFRILHNGDDPRSYFKPNQIKF